MLRRGTYGITSSVQEGADVNSMYHPFVLLHRGCDVVSNFDGAPAAPTMLLFCSITRSRSCSECEVMNPRQTFNCMHWTILSSPAPMRWQFEICLPNPSFPLHPHYFIHQIHPRKRQDPPFAISQFHQPSSICIPEYTSVRHPSLQLHTKANH